MSESIECRIMSLESELKRIQVYLDIHNNDDGKFGSKTNEYHKKIRDYNLIINNELCERLKNQAEAGISKGIVPTITQKYDYRFI